MISDLEAAALCFGIYALPGAPPVTWDHFFTGSDSADDIGICWGLKRYNDCEAVVFRGSVDPHDWLDDAMAAAIRPFDHWAIGAVHAGFYRGMEMFTTTLLPMLSGRPLLVAGHSLGAARADILTGLLIAAKQPPARRVVFGEPKPGFTKFCALAAQVPAASYRNTDGTEHDPVTDVPFTLPMWPYCHPTPLTDVSAQPTVDDPANPFRLHHAALYVAALTAIRDGAMPARG